jgi:hypothetical protein
MGDRVGLAESLTELGRVNVPADAFAGVDGVHREAVRLLGEARRAMGAPTRGEVSSLVAEATSAGFEVEVRDEGLVAIAVGALRGDRTIGAWSSRLARLAMAASAHPHGPIQLRVFGPRGDGRHLAGALVRAGLEEARVSWVRASADARVGDFELVFPAYGPAPADRPSAP